MWTHNFSTKKLIFIAHALICCFLLYLNLFHDFSHTIYRAGMRFNYSDWLTNYSAGFIRRGIAGTFISWIQSSNSAVFDFFLIIFFVNMSLVILWTIFFKVYKLPLAAFIAWCFMPGAVLGNLLQTKYYYRKEYFFLIPILLLAISTRLATQKIIGRMTFYWLYFSALFVSAIALLHHESFFLITLPCMMVISIKNWPLITDSKKKYWILYVSLLLLVFEFMLLIFFQGTKIQGQQIFNSLSPEDQKIIFHPDIKLYINDGKLLYDRVYRAFSVFGSSPREEALYVYSQTVQSGQLGNWVLILLSVVLQFVFMIWILFRDTWKFSFNPIFIYFLQTLISLPIFLMSEDWGRWLSINFQMCFIGYIATKDSNSKINKILAPTTVLLIVLFCFLKTMTQLPECCLLEPQMKAPMFRLLLWLGVNI